MLGCLATAEENTDIRTDLDNELEHAEFYDFEVVRNALLSADKTGISRHEVEQIQNASDTAEQKREEDKKNKTAKQETKIRIPPKTAIAHTLIRACKSGPQKHVQVWSLCACFYKGVEAREKETKPKM